MFTGTNTHVLGLDAYGGTGILFIFLYYCISFDQYFNISWVLVLMERQY